MGMCPKRLWFPLLRTGQTTLDPLPVHTTREPKPALADLGPRSGPFSAGETLVGQGEGSVLDFSGVRLARPSQLRRHLILPPWPFLHDARIPSAQIAGILKICAERHC